MEVTQSQRLDRLGIALSAACALHCVVTPALLFLLPMVGSTFANVWVHRGFALVLVPVGVFAFWRGLLKSGRFRATCVGAAGMSILLWSQVFTDQQCCPTGPTVAHTATNIFASLLIVVGHRLNLIDARLSCLQCHEHQH
jgi:hypothetical protein